MLKQGSLSFLKIFDGAIQLILELEAFYRMNFIFKFFFFGRFIWQYFLFLRLFMFLLGLDVQNQASEQYNPLMDFQHF